jgi:putative PIN family toxin of toxin-antitoxin system
VRVLFDANVLISALLSRTGMPARLIALWLEGAFDLVVCPALLDEVERALGRPKLQARIDTADADRFVELIREIAEVASDAENPPPLHSSDPGDDYLLALAAREQVRLVSGDDHLLALRGQAPVLSPREFLEQIAKS